MKHPKTFTSLIICIVLAKISFTVYSKPTTNIIEPQTQAIDWVWSGQRVWFDFISQGNYQLVAYFDASRQMSVAVRQIGDINGGPWIYHKLPSFLGWDAHNSITAAFDEKGHIHIVGNLHANPLIYFRSSSPYDPRTLKQVDVMISKSTEQQMTYPKFFQGFNNQLFFKYRLGTSNKGKWYYISWNNVLSKWENVHKNSVLDGEDVRSVYPFGPVFGPDGYAHITYVWRETPIASSNHDLSYAKSQDLINWKSANGEPIDLPIKLDNGEIIDPIPMHGGLLNGRTPIGFDSEKRVLVTYQKYDKNGNTQVYLKRYESNGWVEAKISNWADSRVDLDKSGALKLPIVTNKPAFFNNDNNIVVPAQFNGDDWEWVLDHKSLEVLSSRTFKSNLPSSITKYDLDNGIPLRVISLRDEQTTPSTRYYISWEAMHPNRDQARESIPLPSTLRVHRIDN